ncbi:MAG: DUF2225 domain-containing protein [Treponema sp.]|uniref:DUF2225 domain-containing protein n=1 Tax=Treponema sp. TaxID=166 RepID=UPI001B4C70F0|nr:DUF2225 domain-containing protein [Treponema sp.]MBP5588441.1 DUF2225 domain-containing protein [Treponema sp.]MBR0154874.1 DUF2225 domain-containing protein [Treponema sp.]MCR5386321.1 DUF2225 domain-containing protein [Treponema sp.]
MVSGVKKTDEKKKPAISYWSKNKCHCPVCKKDFPREEMLSGNGRMNAGKLTDELHRLYIPSARYGKIYPLIYAIGACPNCHAAFLWNDFKDIDDEATLERIYDKTEERKAAVNAVFPYYDLTRNRNLLDGAAMYYLALLTYDEVDLSYLPTMKRAILTLRLAWLCNDLEEECPGHNYKYAAEIFYKKAIFFYQQAVINETNRIEKSSTLANMGPDTDKNYGWDGVIYLCGLLEHKYGQRDDQALRLKKLDEAKIAIARIFGLGKSTKEKPGPLLEHSRNLYDELTKEVGGELDGI